MAMVDKVAIATAARIVGRELSRRGLPRAGMSFRRNVAGFTADPSWFDDFPDFPV
jgi:hypothetical protein